MFVERLGSRWRTCYALLSSMRFAIALLMVVSVASMVGSLLPQNEPQSVYVAQLGPFWAGLAVALQFNAVYSSWWFLLIMAFLVLSTTACLLRNSPKYLRDMRRYKEHVRIGSLRAMPLSVTGEWSDAGADADRWQRHVQDHLQARQWRVRMQLREAGVMLAARKGTATKLGYMASHSAIVLICLGGLMDSGLWAHMQVWLNWKQPALEYSAELLAEAPPEHTLPFTSPSYRARMMVAEGMSAGMAVLPQTDGFLLQELPFSIELQKFDVDYYSTGMPKQFASEVIIHDRATGQSSPHRIEVNHPLRVHGVDIFQSSFADGGSSVQLAPWRWRDTALNTPAADAVARPLAAVVGQALALPESLGLPGFQLEVSDLRVMNVENFTENAAANNPNALENGVESDVAVRADSLRGRLQQQLQAAHTVSPASDLRNVGPSVQYRLRDGAGQALEFRNYMLPVDLGDGHAVYLWGTRSDSAQDFGYWRIPQDAESSPQSFFDVLQAMHEPQRLAAAITAYAATVSGADGADKQGDLQTQQLASQLMAIWLGQISPLPESAVQGAVAVKGWAAVDLFLAQHVAQVERQRASESAMRVINGIVVQLLQHSRSDKGLAPLDTSTAQTQQFVQQTIAALDESFYYPVPLVFALDGFEQVQASIFEITKTPGRALVYSGSALLIVGVFAMLFVRERRVWIWLGRGDSGLSNHLQFVMALSSNRKTLDVEREFNDLVQGLFGPESAEAAGLAKPTLIGRTAPASLPIKSNQQDLL